MPGAPDEPEFNPFAAPEVTIAARPGMAGMAAFDPDASLAWRDGGDLVIRVGTPLPDRCLKCNREADGVTFTRTYAWHTRWLLLLILLNLFLFIIVALFVQKKATVNLGLCRAHQRRRRAGMRNGWLVFLIGLALIGLAAAIGSEIPGIFGVVLIPIGLYVVSRSSRLLTPRRIDLDFARFRGAGESYLANFRPWNP